MVDTPCPNECRAASWTDAYRFRFYFSLLTYYTLLLSRYIFRVTHLLKEADDNTPDSCLDLAITALSGAAQEWVRGAHPGIAATAIPDGSPNTFLVDVLFEQLRRRFLPSNGALIAKGAFLDTRQTGLFEE